MLTVLVLAGLDTMRGTMGYLFQHLAEHPEHRQRLIQEPELIPSAVEEVAALLHDHLRRRAEGDALPSSTAFSQLWATWSTGSYMNRDQRVSARRRVRDRPRAQQSHGLRQRSPPLPGHAFRTAELQLAVEEWLRIIPDFHVAAAEPLEERGGGAMMTLTRSAAWEVPS